MRDHGLLPSFLVAAVLALLPGDDVEDAEGAHRLGQAGRVAQAEQPMMERFVVFMEF